MLIKRYKTLKLSTTTTLSLFIPVPSLFLCLQRLL
jgi:hypothetical protein